MQSSSPSDRRIDGSQNKSTHATEWARAAILLTFRFSIATGQMHGLDVRQEMNDTVRYFLIILGAALISSILGGGFGALIALISPDFVKELFYTREEVNIVRYAFGMGMIWGLFIGAGVGGFSALLSIVTTFLKNRTESRQPDE